MLYATEELTGLIGAAVVMRPSKSVMDFNVKSLKKKFKDKRFAAGVNRDVIRAGAEMLGWELDELFDRTIRAMQSFAPDRDTFALAGDPLLRNLPHAGKLLTWELAHEAVSSNLFIGIARE